MCHISVNSYLASIISSLLLQVASKSTENTIFGLSVSPMIPALVELISAELYSVMIIVSLLRFNSAIVCTTIR